jgi:hypothetical protein
LRTVSRLAGAVFACWAMGWSFAAEAAPCTPAKDPTIVVTASEAPVQEDRSRAIADLTKRMAGQGPEGPALGLTYSRVGTEIAYAIRAVPSADGTCVAFDRIDATITLNLIVYLASELKPGSCIDGEAKRHEQKHVALERKLLPVAKARVQKALAGVAKRTATGATIEAAGDQLQRAGRQAVDQVLNAFAAEKKAEQLKFDTIEEYQKLSQACSADEIQRLLNP